MCYFVTIRFRVRANHCHWWTTQEASWESIPRVCDVIVQRLLHTLFTRWSVCGPDRPSPCRSHLPLSAHHARYVTVCWRQQWREWRQRVCEQSLYEPGSVCRQTGSLFRVSMCASLHRGPLSNGLVDITKARTNPNVTFVTIAVSLWVRFVTKVSNCAIL